MRLVVPREIRPGERRVAATPETCGKFVKAGMEVLVESGAGLAASHSDADYEAVGATIERDTQALFASADLVVKVAPPMLNPAAGLHEADMIRQGAVLVGLLRPQDNPEVVGKLAARNVTSFAVDCIPRISRAQKMDVLTSMSSLAGYKAVLIAAEKLDRLFPMMMTAAGTITAARVFVIGAGVAGLQAIATARRLGAVVEAYDVRPVVKEQVESLGARFVALDLQPEQAEVAGGYAAAASEDFYRRQREQMTQHVASADAVISTAFVYGKRAPLLITEQMVRQMRPGSIIVDLAAEAGGNCQLTEPGKTVTRHGVLISGPLDLPNSMPNVASQMYARNIMAFVMDYWKDNSFQIDLQEEIMKESVITHDGQVLHALARQGMQDSEVRP